MAAQNQKIIASFEQMTHPPSRPPRSNHVRGDRAAMRAEAWADLACAPADQQQHHHHAHQPKSSNAGRETGTVGPRLSL
jgi:hypothetical protein